jgi:hypothetical protein
MIVSKYLPRHLYLYTHALGLFDGPGDGDLSSGVGVVIFNDYLWLEYSAQPKTQALGRS